LGGPQEKGGLAVVEKTRRKVKGRKGSRVKNLDGREGGNSPVGDRRNFHPVSNVEGVRPKNFHIHPQGKGFFLKRKRVALDEEGGVL